MPTHPYASALDLLLTAGGDRLAPAAVRRRVGRALDLLMSSCASATQRNHRLALRTFILHCMRERRRAFPASTRTLLDFIATEAERIGPDSVAQRVGSVRLVHRAANLKDAGDAVSVQMALRAGYRAAPPRRRQAPPLIEPDIQAICELTIEGLVDLRDRALVLVARDALARRSELVAIDVEDVVFLPDGSGILTIRRAKLTTVDPRQQVWLSPRSVRAIQDWMRAAHVTDGALFRNLNRADRLSRRLNAGHVSEAFRRLAKRIGLTAPISSHSCRVGAVQDLVARGFAMPAITQVGGWRNPQSAQRYAAGLAPHRSPMASTGSEAPLQAVAPVWDGPDRPTQRHFSPDRRSPSP